MNYLCELLKNIDDFSQPRGGTLVSLGSFVFSGLLCFRSHSLIWNLNLILNMLTKLTRQKGGGQLWAWTIEIFEYLNKMALEYFLYSNLCHFPSTNIFGYLFVDFWMTEYIRIFIFKYLTILIYSNICPKPYSNICLSIFNEQWESWSNLCIK